MLVLGPHAPMKAIADDAGVGVGTLYRNFADRNELWAAVVHRSYELVAELVGDDGDDHVDVLLRYLTRVVGERHRLQRGVASGTIRPDVVATDVILAGVMLVALPLAGPAGQLSAQRMARILADGFRRQPAGRVLPRASAARSWTRRWRKSGAAARSRPPN